MEHRRFGLRRILFILLLLLMLGLLALYIFNSPKEMILRFGVRNSFLLTFFIAAIGAFTSMTKFSAYPMVIAMVAGGLNYLLVGLVAGLGLAAGDVLFFLFGYSARDLTGYRSRKKLEHILTRIQRLRTLVVQLLIFVYIACTPLPNNLLSGALAFTGYPFRKAAIPLILGDIVFCTLVAWLAYKGISLV